LGRELLRCRWPAGWRVVGIGRAELDLGNTTAIAAVVAGRPWSIVINCAAYTSVDQAESDIVAAWAINALAPAAFAAACVAADVPMVQLSTDYVFDGAKPVPYEIDDQVGPIGTYGASKLGGELAVRASGARHVILRTAWVVSAHGRNFVKTMLNLAATRDRLRVVADQRGSPTSAADLANAVMRIAVRLVDDEATPTGTYHFSNAGPTNWAEFATEIFRQSGARGGPVAGVDPIPAADYLTPARRPANSLMSHDAIGRDYGIFPRPWQQALGEMLDELIGDAA